MADESFLEVDELLKPISDDNPAGEPVPFDLRLQLDEDRREEDADAYAPDDPMRPEKPKRADWSGIKRKATETLTRTSKDLLTSARLTEALTKLYGFEGLRDGLKLMALLVDQCWDRLNPPIEDGDIEVRLGPFTWIDDPDLGARFPTTVRRLPLIMGSEGAYGWLQWKACQEGHGPVSAEEMEKAIEATPVEHCRAAAGAIAASLENLNLLTENLTAKMGPLGPSLNGIRQALENCRILTQQLLQRKGGDQPEGPAQNAAPTFAGDGSAAPAGTGAGPVGALRPAATRDEAYRQLEQAATLLQQLEPHSPIPYFIRRAVELGRLPYPKLMRVLIRDVNVLTELNREMGIPEEPPPAG